jgi:predicted nuclease of predicted toxin-antitoxin system
MFLANENFPKPSITLLRNNGIEIKSIQEEFPGISDEVVMNIATEANLIILTFDSDYGELIFKYSKMNPPSIVYFREKGLDPLFAGNLLLKILSNSNLSLLNAFTVAEEKNIRQRFYTK